MLRRSRTRLAVLGALSVEPMTGYAIREAIRDVLGHFWSESFGQIYPTLASLVDDGHLTKSPTERAGASQYTLTDSGRAALVAFLSEPLEPTRPRDELLLRLFFGRHLGPHACAALVTEARDAAHQRLNSFAAIRAEIETETGYEADRDYWKLTLSAGEHAAHAAIAWAEETLASLEGFPTEGENRLSSS